MKTDAIWVLADFLYDLANKQTDTETAAKLRLCASTMHDMMAMLLINNSNVSNTFTARSNYQ